MTTLAALVAAYPAAARGVSTRIPAPGGVWRVVVEIADPGAGSSVEWFDITCDVMGWQNVRGADQYAGRYRASVTDLELNATNDSLAPWSPDTSSLFGVHVPLGPGLLIRGGYIRVDSGVVLEWLPRFTNRVERWGDASYAAGVIRRHPIVARDLISSLVGVPVPASSEQNWSERAAYILSEAGWAFGSTIYGATFDTGADVLTVPARPVASSALNELAATLDPAGCIYYTARTGQLIIRPAPWDTFHLDAFIAGADGLPVPPQTHTHFTYLACEDDGLAEWADYETGGAEPFGFDKAEDAVINHVIRVGPGGTFDSDDPVSIQRYDRKTDQGTWLADNDQAAQDLLDYRANAVVEAHPLSTSVGYDGFFPGPAGLDYPDPVEILHKTAPERGTVFGGGTVRQYTERCRPRRPDDTWWDLSFVVDIATVDADAAALLPVEDLAVVDIADTSAEFSWINPTPDIVPTHTQIRILNPASIWATVTYPITGVDWGALEPSTAYEFQVRLIRVVDGLIVAYSPARSVSFTTDATTLPNIVSVSDDGDTTVDFPPPETPGCTLEWELQSSPDTTTWTTELSGTVLGEPWTVTIPDYPYEAALFYRVRRRELCPAPGAWLVSLLYTGHCTDPPALGVAPFGDAIFYLPAICPVDQISEAISEEPASKGFQYADFVSDGDGNVVLVSAGEGIVAYAADPTPSFTQSIGTLDDEASIAAKVLITHQPVAPVTLFHAAGLRLEAFPSGANWSLRASAVEAVGGVTTISGATDLDFGGWYDVAVTHDTATGDLIAYVDGTEEASALGTVGVRHGAGYYQAGVPQASLITNCAVWPRVLAPEELPGFVAAPTVDIDLKPGQADPDTAGGGTVSFIATFSEAVTGFTNADVTLAGTAGATTVGLTGPVGNVYTINCSGMTATGTVVVSIAAGVCTSVASSLNNTASTHTDNSVDWVVPVPGSDLWLDASYTPSVVASGGNLTTIASRSGTYTWTPTGTVPYGSRTLNGLNVLDCDADTLNGTPNGTQWALGTRSLTIMMVFKLDTIKDSNGLLLQQEAVTTGGRYGLFCGPTTINSFYYESGSVNRSVAAAFTATTPTLVTARVKRQGAGSTHILRVNGTQVATSTFTDAGANYVSTFAAPQVAAFAAISTYRLDGYIAEMIVWFDDLSDGEILAGEALLTGKWGL